METIAMIILIALALGLVALVVIFGGLIAGVISLGWKAIKGLLGKD